MRKVGVPTDTNLHLWRRWLTRALFTFVVVVTLRSTHAQQTPAGDTHHLLFFGTHRPVFVRLQIESNGRTLRLIREHYLELLFFALDRNRDARLSADEAHEIPADGRFGRDGQTMGEGWVEWDTAPQDGSLSPEEFAAGLDPLLGTGLVMLNKPPRLVQSVQLHPRLDTDRDRRVSSSELESALLTLRSFDFDDDGTFSAAELQPFPQSMLAAAMMAESGEDRRAFVMLDADEPRPPLARRILREYAGQASKGLKWGSVEFDRRAFAAADKNRDKHLDEAELTEVLNSPPADVDLLVSLSSHRVRLASRPPKGVELVESDRPGRLTLQIGGETVELDVDIDFGFNDAVAFLLTTRFRTADGDADGALNEAEFGQLGGVDAQIGVVDFDGDGEVVPAELERFAMLDARLVQSSVEMSVERRDPQPFFEVLDENSDRRLTPREFNTAAARLRKVDHDADGQIAEDELVEKGSYRLSFSFGVPPVLRDDSRMMMANDRRMPIVTGLTSGPEWFQRMDRNQDGDVMWREFLGSRKDFDQFDRDANGWIDATEAETDEIR